MKNLGLRLTAVLLVAMVAFSGIAVPAKAAPSIGIIQNNSWNDYATLLGNLGLSYSLIPIPLTLSTLTSYDLVLFDAQSSGLPDAEEALLLTAFAQGTSFFISYDDISTGSAESLFNALVGASDFANDPENSTPTILASSFPNGYPTNSASRTLDFNEFDQEYVTCSTCTILDNAHEIVARYQGCTGVLYLGDSIGSVSDLSATGVLGTLFRAFYDSLACGVAQKKYSTPSLLPLANTRIAKATELSAQANDLLAQAQGKNLDTASCEALIKEGSDYLALAKKYKSYATANYFGVKAEEKFTQAIECLKALLG